MQPALDLFLGLDHRSSQDGISTSGNCGDAKIKPLIETFDAEMLELDARCCGWVLARAHAKASEVAELPGILAPVTPSTKRWAISRWLMLTKLRRTTPS